MEKIKIKLFRYGVLLLLLGLLTGIYVSLAMTQKINVDSNSALISHLSALMGAFMIFGLALSLPYLRYTENTLRKLSIAIIVANYTNWFVSGIKAYFQVQAIALIGESINDILYIIMTLFMVIPAISGTIFWLFGFKKSTN